MAGDKNLVPDEAAKSSAGKDSSHALLNSAYVEDSYKTAVRSAFDAESNWHHALSKGQASLSADDVDKLAKDPQLDPASQGFVRFLHDNFSKIAGATSGDGKHDKVTLPDLMAIGGMNEVDPTKMLAGVKFVQDKFFQISGLDNQVSADRIQKLLYDHSFSLFPKDTQELIYDAKDVLKSADQRPENFAQNKRVKSGLSEDDATKLNAVELTDNLRIQALERAMFGNTASIKLDGSSTNPKSLSQYDEAAKRYHELQKSGLNDFLNK